MIFLFLRWISIATAVLCLLSACSEARNSLRTVSIEAIESANQNQSTAVDIVLIYDSNMLSVLPKSAPEWFANKSSLLAGLGENIKVVSVQVPASSVTSVTLPKDISKAVQVLSYANYISSEGQASGNLTSYKCVRIVLQVQHAIYAACS